MQALAVFRKGLSILAPLMGLIFVYGLFLALCYWKDIPSFWSLYNTKTILTQAVIVGIGALGMTIIIISGGIDLSIGSLIALGTVVAAWVLSRYGGDEAGWGISIAAALAALAACGVCGLFNGAIIAWLGIVPFIVTLGMMQIARGAANWLADEQTVTTPINMLEEVMIVEPRMDVWYSIAPGVWVMLILLLFVVYLLRFTAFGRYVFAIGSNEATARLCGVRVRLQKLWIYMLGGLFAGVASVMQFANLSVGDPTAAVGKELDIIAAVVIGGGSLSGGEGSPLGSIVGALIMAVLRSGCTMLGVPNFVQDIVIGVIIILAVGIDQLKHGRFTLRGAAA